MKKLTLAALKKAVGLFIMEVSSWEIVELYGVTDGKAVGTYIERQFDDFLVKRFAFDSGNAASGIDFPDLNVDLKVTSLRQPQSSCPFRDASQKIYGLGYHLLVFVYDKLDDPEKGVAHLNFVHAIFVDAQRASDYQTTSGLLGILARNGNADDIVAFLEERNLPLDEIGRIQLAERILKEPPREGYLTVSNALQWRLQYGRVIGLASAGNTDGVENLAT